MPSPVMFGAGDESRTRDLNLGKVALYQLSYSRIRQSGSHYNATNCVRQRVGCGLLCNHRGNCTGNVIDIAIVERCNANAPAFDRIDGKIAS